MTALQPAERLQVKIKDAANMLAFSERMIYELLRRGELKSVGTGRLRRIPVAELRAWQARNLN
jgi:excisionase family DNA binding protein